MRLLVCVCFTFVLVMGTFTDVSAVDGGIPSENNDQTGGSEFVKPTAEIGKGPFEKPDEFAQAEIIASKKIKIAERDDVNAIVRGIVIDTKPFLFSFEDSEGVSRFEIYTRVSAVVSNSYKSQLSGNVEFWVHGGVIEEEERIVGFPYVIVNSNDIRFEVGDEFLACLNSNATLPDGRTVNMLWGASTGVSFPESPQSELDAAVAAIVEAHLAASQRSFP